MIFVGGSDGGGGDGRRPGNLSIQKPGVILPYRIEQ